MSRRERDHRPPRRLRRDGDGTLYDLDERRAISLAELADEVQAGRRFRAFRHGSERDCTQQVLLEVLGACAPTPPATPAALGLGARLPSLAPAAVHAVAGLLQDRRSAGRDDSTATRAGVAEARRRPRPRIDFESDEIEAGSTEVS